MNQLQTKESNDSSKSRCLIKPTLWVVLMGMLHISATTFSQNKTFTFDLKDVTVGEIMTKVEMSSVYRFLYKTKTIKLDRRVSIVTNEASIEIVLEQLFVGTNIEYEIFHNQIVLRNGSQKKIKEDDSSFGNDTIPSLQPETKLIAGHVFNVDDAPLIGATLWNTSSNNGTVTDFNGYYELEVAVGDSVLVSSLGHADQALVVMEANVYDMVLYETAIDLQTVELVSTGYQTISKERTTGSFENISTQTLDRKISQNIFSEIKGEVSGVLFNNSDGGEDEIIVRGLSSINANTSPLIVVDGFPIEGGLNTINPNDVKSISILKDAAAASIWGIRATNGVIVIVTKNGNRKKPLSIDISANTAITRQLDLKDNNLGSPQTQVDFIREQYDRGYFTTAELYQGEAGNSFFSSLNPMTRVFLEAEVGLITEEERETRLAALANIDARDEYADLFLQPEISNQYNLSISGGAKKHDYRVSLTYNNNQGSTIDTKSDQVIANIRNNVDLSDKLKLRTSINTSFSKAHLALTEPIFPDNTRLTNRASDPRSFLSGTPLSSSILDENGGYLPMFGGMEEGFSTDAQAARGFALPWTYNLKQEFDNNDNILKNLELRLQASLSYEIFDGLTLEGRYQYETGSGQGRNHLNLNRYITRHQINLFSQFKNNQLTDLAVPLGAIADFRETNLNSQTFRTQLNFNKTLGGELHQITALGGYEIRKVINEARETRRYGYDDQSLIFLNPIYRTNYRFSVFNGSSQIIDPSAFSFIENRFISYYANAAYTYDYKYTISASTRLDDTNLFGASDEYRNIPLYSVGLKWNIQRESFFKVPAITDLKLKATYGINGNVDNSTSPFLQAASFNAFGLYNNFSSYIQTVPNPELRLEKTETLNLGLDVELWGGDMTANIDFYQKDSKDLLSFKNLNATSGVNAALLNIGELTNKGVDISVSAMLVKTEKFRYRMGGNFSFNDNELTKVETPSQDIQSFIDGSIVQIGNPLRTFYSFNYAGLDNNGKPQYFDTDGGTVDYTQAISDANALVKEGTTVARYYGSWINEFSFNNWSLRALTIFDGGQKFRLENFYDPGNQVENTFRDFDNRWRQEGDEATTDIPAVPDGQFDSFSLGYQFYSNANKFVDNATTIRLQEVIVSYAFDSSILEKLRIQQLQFSIQANNLMVWNFNKWDVDPANQLFPLQPRVTFNVLATL